MNPFILLLGALPLLGFYLWMFRDMARNDAIPDQSSTGFNWPPVAKSDWFIMFIVFNVFAAALYYVNIYRYRR